MTYSVWQHSVMSIVTIPEFVLLEISETGIVTKCSLSVSFLLICCLFLVSHQKTDTVEGMSTDEGEGRRSLVPDQHPGQEPH